MNKQTRIKTFLLYCVTARILLMICAKSLLHYLPIIGVVTLLQAFGFLYLYFSNSRLNAFESGGQTWWHDFRIVHGILYLLFSINAIQKNKKSWIYLAVDILFGLLVFSNHHFLKIKL